MLRAAILWLLVALAGFSTSRSVVAEPLGSGSAPRQKVYLLRGFTNVLSPGIDQLAEELRKRNISTTVANHAFSASLASEAIADCKGGRISSIALVGHSFGASAALAMADTLSQAGVQVALIVKFDPVIKNTVPGNVRLIENFYLSNGVGQPVQHGDHFRGLLRNVDLKSNADVGHVSVTTLPSIHKQVLQDILAANTRCRG